MIIRIKKLKENNYFRNWEVFLNDTKIGYILSFVNNPEFGFSFDSEESNDDYGPGHSPSFKEAARYVLDNSPLLKEIVSLREQLAEAKKCIEQMHKELGLEDSLL